MQAKATSRIDRALPVVPTGVIVCAMVLPLMHAGCTSYIDIPDQSEFAPLDDFVENGEPVARVYVAPTRGVGFLSTHAWFVVKRADSDTFDRWEVSTHSEGPYGYVQHNRFRPEDYYTTGIFILAELVGEEARDVVEIINREAPRYPCRNYYLYYPGPNCNTFAQWLLDQAEWDVELPFMALGQYTPVLCW